MKEHEGAEITEDDLLEEPDVSLGDEGQEPVSLLLDVSYEELTLLSSL